MRKRLASRIFGLVVIYCAVFFILVILQFSKKGDFSLSAGAMTIKGRYLQLPPSQASLRAAENSSDINEHTLSGGVKVFFGGLEFNLKEDNEKGLIMTAANGSFFPANPDLLLLTDSTARFDLSDGTTLIFNSLNSARGMELQISAEFAENISEVTIPVVPRRSSLIRDNDQTGVLYNGDRYFFSSLDQKIENAKLILSRGNAFISYRSRGKEKIFDPADYIIAQAQNYESALIDWQNSSFANWNQNAAFLQNEDDVIAYCSEALRQGYYGTAVRSISRDFINSSRHTYRSSVYVGGMIEAYRTFSLAERDKINLITRLIREGSHEIFKERHVLDFLLTRNNTALANEVIDLIRNTEPEMLTSDYCPGLLEIYEDIKLWRPSINNPVESLAEQILLLVSENLNRDTEKNLVFASHSGGADLEYNLRLGKALVYWAQAAEDTEWAAIGRSLVLSALTSGAGSGNLYCILNPGNYYPRASLLADNGLWAWTVSPVINASYIESNLNISFSFQPDMSHYVILRGIRPFIKMQIHDMDWRTDSQFERYDSSGWVYYSQEQILVLKLRHRAVMESIRIIYREEAPPPVIQAEPEATAEETAVETAGEPAAQ